MSLFKKVKDALVDRAAPRVAEYAARKTAEKAKQTARGTAARIERAMFGDNQAYPDEKAPVEKPAQDDDGGPLGRFAARKRKEEEEALRTTQGAGEGAGRSPRG